MKRTMALVIDQLTFNMLPMAATDWLTYYRSVLKSRGYSQLELAKHLGLSEGQASRLLNGKASITVTVARKMAEFLNLELAEMLDPDHHHVFHERDQVEAAEIIGQLDDNQRRLALTLLRELRRK